MLQSSDNRLAWTIEEFAILVGYGKSTIRKRIRNGELRAVRDGCRTTRILPADGEAFVASLSPIIPHKPKT